MCILRDNDRVSASSKVQWEARRLRHLAHMIRDWYHRCQTREGHLVAYREDSWINFNSILRSRFWIQIEGVISEVLYSLKDTLTIPGRRSVFPNLNPRRNSCRTVPSGTVSFDSRMIASWKFGSNGWPTPGTASTPKLLKASTICLYNPCRNCKSIQSFAQRSLVSPDHGLSIKTIKINKKTVHGYKIVDNWVQYDHWFQ